MKVEPTPNRGEWGIFRGFWKLRARNAPRVVPCFFFFFTLVTGPRRSLSIKLSDTRVYEPQIRARLGTTAHFGGPMLLGFALL